MQLLTRKIALNLVRHVSKATSVAVPNFQQKLTSLGDGQNVASTQLLFRNYASTKTNPQDLPHFPVPPLNETIEKFLKTTVPVLTESEYQETCKEAKHFLETDGAKLQGLLEEVAKKSENWLADRWLKFAYLGYRDPVCIYVSPGMTFPPRQFKSDAEWLKYTAKTIFIALKYKELVDNNKIPLEKMGDKQLDMSQYGLVFGTCRMPAPTMDYHCFYPKSQHVAVVYKGHWFCVPVYASCAIIHPDLIYKQLQIIVNKVTKKEDNPIGVLTTLQRDDWANAYCDVIADPKNKASVEKIQSSLFTVALDEKVPVKYGENEMIVVSEQLIHGGGSKQNAGNRWMDKTIQLCVNPNGVNGFCYEHSPAEGQPIAIMTDYIVKNIDDQKITEGSQEKVFNEPVPLPITINDSIRKHISKANKDLDKLANNLQICVLHYKRYGKEFIKTQKLSPDSYLQMAMQYAFYKMHNAPAPHYESAHLRLFPGGRTETIRSCSSESLAFAKSMVENCPDDQRIKLLKAAVTGHRQYTQMALQGKGVDRHLLGLKLMALENKMPVPKFYNTPGVQKTVHFRLSTSQVASKYESFMAYGPAVDDGYGLCYNPRSNDMYFAISCWVNNKETDSHKLCVAMRDSLDAMQDLLSRAGEKPKAKM